MADVSIDDKSNESIRRYTDELSGAKNTLNGLIQKMGEFNAINEKMSRMNIPSDVIEGMKADQELALKSYASEIAGSDADGETMIGYVRSIMTKNLDSLNQMIIDVQKKLSGSTNPAEGAKYQHELDVLRNQANKEIKNTKERTNVDGWNDFSTTGKDIFKTVTDGIKGFEGLDEASKAVVSSINTVATETLKGIDQIVALTNTSTAAMDGASKVSFATMSTVEKASAILAIVGIAMKIASTIANLLGDGAKEREIKDIQGDIDNLSLSYDRLGKSLETAYASDSVRILEDQNKNLEEQKKLVEEQMALENSKKNTDQSKMNNYQKNLNKLNDTIAANENAMVKAILGKDVKEAINDFSKAYVQAWDAGTDKAKAMKDVVKSMIKSAIGEFVKARLSGEVEEFTKYLAKAMEDGILTEEEKRGLAQRENAIVDKGNELDGQLSWAKEENEQNRSASSKGIAQASQESIDDLSGRMTNIQEHTYNILEEVRNQRLSSEQILAQIRIINESAQHLSRLEVIEKRISSMDSNINDVVLRGIKLNGK